MKDAIGIAARGRLRTYLSRGKVLRWLKPRNVLFALTTMVGVLGGLSAVVFRKLADLVQELFFGEGALIDMARGLPWYLCLAIPALGGLAAGLIVHFGLKEGGTTGVSEVMEAVSLRAEIKPRPTLIRSLSAMFSIGSGASIGREGPIVAIAALIGSSLAQLVAASKEQRQILIGCGVAAGIAGAYNAPIASALFVMEIIVGNFALEVFGPLVISSVVSTLITRSMLGDVPLYRIPEFILAHPGELAVYIALGALAGLFAWIFMASLALFEKWSQAIRGPIYVRTAVGGLLVGAIGIAYPQVWGNGYAATSLALGDHLPLQLLAILLVAKIVATSITVASGASGGVFTPTLFVGAALGGVVGWIAHSVAPTATATPGAYALVGMGALLAATTHAPIMAILMIFEISRDYNVILPLMLSCILSNWVARGLKPQSLYTDKLERKGFHWQAGIEEIVLRGLKVEDLMRSNVPLVPRALPFAQVVTKFYGGRTNYLYVGGDEGQFLGVIDLHDVKEHFADPGFASMVVAADVAVDCPTVRPSDAVADILEDYWLAEMGQLPVVDGSTGRKFLGIVRRVDLLAVLNREILKKELLLAKFVRKTDSGTVTDYMELPAGYRLDVVPIPSDSAGKSLQTLDLRQRFGVNVLAVSRPGKSGGERMMAEPGLVLAAGDELLLVGRDEAIAAMLEKAASGG